MGKWLVSFFVFPVSASVTQHKTMCLFSLLDGRTDLQPSIQETLQSLMCSTLHDSTERKPTATGGHQESKMKQHTERNSSRTWLKILSKEEHCFLKGQQSHCGGNTFALQHSKKVCDFQWGVMAFRQNATHTHTHKSFYNLLCAFKNCLNVCLPLWRT